MRLRVKSENAHVGNHAAGPASAQIQFFAAAPAYEAGTCKVSHGEGKFSFLMAHDHNYALGQRGDIVSSGAAIHIPDLPGLIFHKRRIDVAVPVQLQSSQKPYVDHTSV